MTELGGQGWVVPKPLLKVTKVKYLQADTIIDLEPEVNAYLAGGWHLGDELRLREGFKAPQIIHWLEETEL